MTVHEQQSLLFFEIITLLIATVGGCFAKMPNLAASSARTVANITCCLLLADIMFSSFFASAAEHPKAEMALSSCFLCMSHS